MNNKKERKMSKHLEQIISYKKEQQRTIKGNITTKNKNKNREIKPFNSY